MRLRRSRVTVVTLLLTIHSAATAQHARLSPAEVAAAIREGAQSKGAFGVTLGSGSSDDLRVELKGPYGRVATLSARKRLRARDVPPEVLTHTLEVVVHRGAQTPPPTDITFERTDRAGIPAADDRLEPTTLTTGEGGLLAYFDLSALPAVDLTLAVRAGTREYRYPLPLDQREKLR